MCVSGVVFALVIAHDMNSNSQTHQTGLYHRGKPITRIAVKLS